MTAFQHDVGNAGVSRALAPTAGAVVQRAVTVAEVKTLPEDVQRAIVLDFPRVLSEVLGRTVPAREVLDAAKDLATVETDARHYLQLEGQIRDAAAELDRQRRDPDAYRRAVEVELLRDLAGVSWLPQSARGRLVTALVGRVRVVGSAEFARLRLAEWLAIPGVQVTDTRTLQIVMGSWRALAFAERYGAPRHLNLRAGVVQPHHAIHEALHILSGAGWDKHVGDGDARGWPGLVEGATELVTTLVLMALKKEKSGEFYAKNVTEIREVMAWTGIDAPGLVDYYFRDASDFRTAARIDEVVPEEILGRTGGVGRKKVGASSKETTQ
ncbi:hypothetical protein [Cellulosimicrobium protaetiae]|uniref:Uncharacterized protein n=1 Tax=Cellulosimicrobium protaetiae TaxID=2587808 RepID=A0A6M5U9G0_9MICO|nr:hypothetical protein [Cellulosimicrobium protaetiae]QJW34880.1 hypothetical protein FIC82_000360 [Cellulosimicrobium protaetiae]